MNKKLWYKIKKKQRLWMRLKIMREDGEHNIREYNMVEVDYRQLNNQIRRQTRRASKDKEKEISENVKSNPKFFLKYVWSKTKTATGIRNLYMNREKTVEIQNEKEKATMLAEFFKTVFTREPEGEVQSIQAKEVSMLTQIHFTYEEVKRAIGNLKRDKVPGPEGFHPRIIKEVKNEILGH